MTVTIPVGDGPTGVAVTPNGARAYVVNQISGAPKMCVQLSRDGGATWTTAESTATLTTSDATPRSFSVDH